jgi:plasmid stability protein
VKNITVTVDDDLYRASRIAAAEHQTSVSALVRGYLTALVEGEAEARPRKPKARDDGEELVNLFQESKLVLGYRPNRSKTYDRP